MPYIKKSRPHEALTKLIRAEGLTYEELGRIFECSRQLASTKVNNPGRLTINDLVNLSRKAHIPIEQIREAIKV